MKLGLSMWSYVGAFQVNRLDVVGFIDEAKRLGVDGVELLEFFWRDTGADIPAAIAKLDEVGLPCGVYSTANNFAQSDASQRAAQVEHVRDAMMIAKRLHAPVVRVFAGNLQDGIDYDMALDWIVEGLAECARAADGLGLKLALENHGALAGRSDQVCTIIERVRAAAGNDALGANPDTGNFMIVHENSVEAVRGVAKYTYMVHFKDFKAAPDGFTGPSFATSQGAKLCGTAIGEGDVDLAGCVSELRAVAFDGFLNIEYEAAEDPFSGVPRSVANARRYVPGG
jgi:sugar phosphate isomerase/epimerase